MRGLNKAESAALREIAARHGYIVARGPTARGGAEAGNPIHLMLAIIGGEIATVLLGDEERAHAIELLLVSEDETLRDIGAQLLAAVRREEHADEDEIAEYIEERRPSPTPHAALPRVRRCDAALRAGAPQAGRDDG